MIASKVILEIRFRKRVPKQVLEQAVEDLINKRSEILKPYQKHDACIRIWYDDMSGVPSVSMVDMLPKNPFKRIFRRGKRGDVK